MDYITNVNLNGTDLPFCSEIERSELPNATKQTPASSTHQLGIAKIGDGLNISPEGELFIEATDMPDSRIVAIPGGYLRVGDHDVYLSSYLSALGLTQSDLAGGDASAKLQFVGLFGLGTKSAYATCDTSNIKSWKYAPYVTVTVTGETYESGKSYYIFKSTITTTANKSGE